MSHSPVSPSVYQSMNRGAVQPPPPNYARRPSFKEEVSESITSPTRQTLTSSQAPAPPARADPMSLSSIMSSGTDNEPTTKSTPLPSINHQLNPPHHPLVVKQEPQASPAPLELAPHSNGILHQPPYEPLMPLAGTPQVLSHDAKAERPPPDEAQVEAALAHIETKQMNDPEGMGDPNDDMDWKERTLKRAHDVASTELSKRKVSDTSY